MRHLIARNTMLKHIYQPKHLKFLAYRFCLTDFRSKKNASGKNQNLEGKDGAYLTIDVPQRTNVLKGCRTILTNILEYFLIASIKYTMGQFFCDSLHCCLDPCHV